MVTNAKSYTMRPTTRKRRTRPTWKEWLAIFIVTILCLLMTFLSLTLTSCSKSEITPEFKEGAPLGVELIDPPNPGTQMSAMLKSLDPNRMPNGGGDGSLDWYDENANGCGDGWTYWPQQPGWATQITVPCMTGVDVVQRLTAPHQFVLVSPLPVPVSSQWHELRFWYRSTVPMTVTVRLTDRCG